jgi:hypothetical protein
MTMLDQIVHPSHERVADIGFVFEEPKCLDCEQTNLEALCPTKDNRLIESNELHYLRWFHKNAADWVNPNSACQRPAIFVHSMNLAYQDETGRKVPSDYEVGPR